MLGCEPLRFSALVSPLVSGLPHYFLTWLLRTSVSLFPEIMAGPQRRRQRGWPSPVPADAGDSPVRGSQSCDHTQGRGKGCPSRGQGPSPWGRKQSCSPEPQGGGGDSRELWGSGLPAPGAGRLGRWGPLSCSHSCAQHPEPQGSRPESPRLPPGAAARTPAQNQPQHCPQVTAQVRRVAVPAGISQAALGVGQSVQRSLWGHTGCQVRHPSTRQARPGFLSLNDHVTPTTSS